MSPMMAMMSANAVGRLHIVQGMMNQHQYIRVLEQKLIPDLTKHFPDGGGIFQHDSAPCHTAMSVTAFMKQKKIPVHSWPGNSTDINPIENVWTIVKRRIADQQSDTD